MIEAVGFGRRAPRWLLSAAPVLFSISLAACGGYDPPAKGGGGSSGSGPGGGTGGSAAGTGGTPGGGGGAGGAQGGGGGMSGGSGGAGGAQGGGGGGGPVGELPCPMPVPTDTMCGGDLVGTWAATSCPLMVTGDVNMMGLGLGCQTAPITSGSLEVTETLTITADGKYTDKTKTTGEQKIELPATCLTVSGFVTTCDRVSDPFASTLGYKSVKCVDNEETGGCSCDAVIEQTGGFAMVSLASPDKGTYKAEGGILTLTAEKVDTQYNFCVGGTTAAMTFKTVGKTGTVNGTIVLQKQ